MNLIEISEQLKDVPDQLLMKEVQAPSGAYPAYLVVTEMSRRKRMRDQAMKEAPTTTVAQDLSQPSREQLMAAMAAMQRGPEAPPEPPMAMPAPMPRQAQGMSQPAQRLNAPGIMAAPQAAQALAAQDVMGAQEPRRMAGGGMVAFAKGGDIKFDDRGTVMFADQGRVPTWDEVEAARQLWMKNQTPWYMPTPMSGDPSKIYLDEYKRLSDAFTSKTPLSNIDMTVTNYAQKNPLTPLPETVSSVAVSPSASSAPVVPAPAASAPVVPAPASAAPVVPELPALPDNLKNFKAPGLGLKPVTVTPYVDPYADLTRQNLEAFRNYKEPTQEALATQRAAAEKAYGEKNPFRYGFLEQDIAKREGEMKGRKESNINEALMQAGLGIMGSKSPRFLQAVSEGGLSALGAYRQGVKDIREGEKDILQSKTALANAQSLYDQGKYNAGEKAEEKAYQQYDRGLSRLNSESAILARNQSAALGIGQLNQQGQLTAAQINQAGQIAQATHGLNSLKTQMELAKLPYELRESTARAQYYTNRPTSGMASDADQKAAEESARSRAMMSGKPFGSPEYQQLFQQYYAEELQRRAAGVNYKPGGASSAPGALPPGWSVQQR